MASRGAVSAASRTSDESIRRQLERIVNSKTFQTVERLRRFMSFIVLETLEGRGDQLKEFVVGVQVFDKEPSFDPRNDPIVRVQARRLRSRLARYYLEEGQNDEVLIDLPKGGYSAVFKHRDVSAANRPMTAVLVSRNTVLVLPFMDNSPAGDLDYFCRGIGQEITHRLAGIESIRVIAAEGAHMAGAGGPVLPNNRAGAATVITGGVRRSGDDLRITAQLIDGGSGSYLWSESIDGKMADIFRIQEQVAEAISKRLQAQLGSGSNGRRTAKPTENLAAHNLYVQGRYHLSQRTEESLRKALDFFEKTIVEDAHYANAYAGLADSYGLLGHYGVLAPAEVWTKAASNAAWAVLQDENSAEAHTSLAHVKSTQDWDWLGAEQEFLRALQLDPRSAPAHHWYAMSCLAPMARLDEALEHILVAQALDPISAIIARDVAMVHYYRRDFENALERCDHAIELNPHFSPAYWALGLIQEQMHDFDESAAAFQRAIQLSPNSPRMHGALGRTMALSGKHPKAIAILAELKSAAEQRYVSPFEFASIHFALGETDAGFEWLKKAFQDRCFELVAIKVDPRFDPISSDPRFLSLAAQLGFH